MALTQISPGILDSNAQYYGFKNRIINGAMGIWQRGTSFTSSPSYTADRWSAFGYSWVNVSQSTSVPTGFQYSIKVGRPSGNTSTNTVIIGQAVESTNCYDLAGQTVTLSFWAKAGANFSGSNSFVAQIATGTVADQGLTSYPSWTGYTSPVATALSISTTWTKYTVTGTFGSGVLETAVIIYYVPSGTAGADDAIYITGVQLEKGSTATSFDVRPYGTELMLCQRYLPCLNSSSTTDSISLAYTPSTTIVRCDVPFKVTPRVPPTGISVSSASHLTWDTGGASGTPSAVTFTSSSLQTGRVALAVTGATVGQCAAVGFNSASGQIQFTGCEL